MYGKRICELRQQMGISQEELAKRLGEKLGVSISQNSISKYEKETREPNNDTLIALSYLFNVSVDFLLGITDIRDTSITDEILKYLKVLTEDDLQSLLKVARYLKWQEEHREEEQ